MKVFITGATGWVGSAVVAELLKSGHQVTGLVRSRDKAATLTASGAVALPGTLDDLTLLRQAAQAADAVIHTAFNHDFSRFAQSAQQGRLAIETLGGALKGSTRPLLVTAGLAHLTPGRVATEQDVAPTEPRYPRQSEAAAMALVAQGVRAGIVRLAASVHGSGDHDFIAALVSLAREKGVSAFLDDGQNVGRACTVLTPRVCIGWCWSKTIPSLFTMPLPTKASPARLLPR
ncbi:NAD(P)H-binding protein [Candidatus Sodalis endolongispinus]|uniref:NAD(P)H-binding protein n=1 Tax=Candidatus Sodalis endolongispinus TaxID=2812662 RepID=UPI001FEAD82C|nr:NAD(P)H-binding protein [Candidatus Sodalis endolongispinus]